MTAITTRPLSDSTDSLLRFALRADATLCAALGLLVAMAADPLSRLSGLSPTAEWVSGAGFVAYGALLYVLAAVSDLRLIGIAVVAGNVAFATVVVTAIVAGWLSLTGLGVAMVLATTVATLGFAYLQYLGVRRLSA